MGREEVWSRHEARDSVVVEMSAHYPDCRELGFVFVDPPNPMLSIALEICPYSWQRCLSSSHGAYLTDRSRLRERPVSSSPRDSLIGKLLLLSNHRLPPPRQEAQSAHTHRPDSTSDHTRRASLQLLLPTTLAECRKRRRLTRFPQSCSRSQVN